MAPRTLDDLNLAEQLLLLCWRRSGHGTFRQPCVEMAWRLGCGDALGARSAFVFDELRKRLQRGRRRPLDMAPTHAATLSMDERSVLELVAACQCGAFAMATALARWLVRAPAHVAVLGAAAALARAMEEGGLMLRPPSEFRADRTLFEEHRIPA